MYNSGARIYCSAATAVFPLPHHFQNQIVLLPPTIPATLDSPLPPSLPASLCPRTLLLDFQYQVISLQGAIGRDMDRLNGPGQWGVDHGLHLHGREDTQRLTLLHLS